MSRRSAGLVAAVVLVASLAACGGGSSIGGKGPPTGSDAAPKDPARPLGCAGVFLAEGSNVAQAAAVRTVLERSPLVRSVRAVSKEQALEYYRQRYPERTNSLAAGPLPDTLYVTPRRGSDLGSIRAQLRRFGKLVGHVQLDATPCPR